MKKFFLILALVLGFAAGAQKYRGNDHKTEKKEIGTGLFQTPDATVFDMEDENNSNSALSYTNILDWLQGRVAGLQVYTRRDGSRIAFIRNTPATVFIDEMRTDVSLLGLLPVNDIAAIKIIRQPFALGAPGGVIAVYTKRGDEDTTEEAAED